MILSEKNSYKDLFNAWREELQSNTLTPLNLNFIKSYLLSIESFSSENTEQNFINEVFIKRIEFLIQNLIELRKIKIINLIINKEQIETSYLSKQELLFYDYLKNSENILKNKSITFPNQLKEYLYQNSNMKINDEFFEYSVKEIQPIEDEEKETEIDVEEVTVVFLKDVDEFIYVDNKIYGPFKKNEVAVIPKELFSKILFPKKFVQRND